MSDYKNELLKLSKARMDESLKEIELINERMKFIQSSAKTSYQLNAMTKSLRLNQSAYELNSYIYKSLKYELDKLNLR